VNARQKKFVLEKLIPFIQREHGRGFGMSSWRKTDTPGYYSSMDGIARKVPPCGTLCCIGGSIAVLKKIDDDYITGPASIRRFCERHSKRVLGLDPEIAYGLFMGWNTSNSLCEYLWPTAYRLRFDDANCPEDVAEVAASLLRLVCETNGRCMEPVSGEK